MMAWHKISCFPSRPSPKCLNHLHPNPQHGWAKVLDFSLLRRIYFNQNEQDPSSTLVSFVIVSKMVLLKAMGLL